MSELKDTIKQVIDNEPVALFMKGTPQFVMCGNSHRALEALRSVGAPVTAVDVLPDPQIVRTWLPWRGGHRTAAGVAPTRVPGRGRAPRGGPYGRR